MSVTPSTLRRLAGGLWLAVGLGLAVRGTAMLVAAHGAPEHAGLGSLFLSGALGLWIGAYKGRYVLARTAAANRARIAALTEPRPWQVFSGRTALLVLAMIALGVGLRALAARGWIGGFTVVGGIYLGIGAALAVSSRAYFRALPPPPRPGAGPPETRRPPVGCLVVNLGTPDAPTPVAVRRYLREFLSDPRVVELPRALWAFVLNAIVLPLRGRASARAYAKVWTSEGSPLLVNTERAARALAQRLGPRFHVITAMRYGHPSLSRAVSELVAMGCESVVALPLFPQYSNTTTGSVQAALARTLARHRAQPALALVPPFYDHPAYLTALVERVRATPGSARVDHWVFSFHGLPDAYVRAGDPYLLHCERTAWALAERLALERTRWDLAFQSRFGSEPWLGPDVAELVPALAARAPRVLVALPGFAADCLETLEEIGMRLRESFLAAGGEELVVVPALNDSPAWIDALETLVRANAPTVRAAPEDPERGADGAGARRRGEGAGAL